MSFCACLMWHSAKKSYSAVVIVLTVLIVTPYGSLAGTAAAPNLKAISSTQPKAVASDDTTSALPSPAPVPTFQAVITQYSRIDSCHTVKNGKCIMASGRPVYVGAAACPKFLDLGTRVKIDGKSYTCEDRYAKWLDRKRGLPTVDIFVDKNPYGNSVKTVTIQRDNHLPLQFRLKRR